MKKANNKASNGVKNAKNAHNGPQNGQNGKNCGKSSPENCDR